jgi:hypothetical protein
MRNGHLTSLHAGALEGKRAGPPLWGADAATLAMAATPIANIGPRNGIAYPASAISCVRLRSSTTRAVTSIAFRNAAIRL